MDLDIQVLSNTVHQAGNLSVASQIPVNHALYSLRTVRSYIQCFLKAGRKRFHNADKKSTGLHLLYRKLKMNLNLMNL